MSLLEQSIKNLVVVVALLALALPVTSVDALMCHHTIWNKPEFLVFPVRAARWEPVRLPLPIKTINIPSPILLAIGTEGLQPIIQDFLKEGVIKHTTFPFNSPI